MPGEVCFHGKNRFQTVFGIFFLEELFEFPEKLVLLANAFEV